MTLPVYPLINGVRYDHSSCDIKLDGQSYFGVKSIDYTPALEPGELYGTAAQRIGRTRGQLKNTASVELYRAEYDDFALRLTARSPGIGLLECVFDIVVNYKPEGGLAMVTDKIIGCRIKSPAVGSPGGSEALAVKCDLDPTYILLNNLPMITGLRR